MARIEDVARLAGVSIKTVSRVINAEAGVRDTTRERVQAAIGELGYRPDPYARSLAGQRSWMLALLYGQVAPGYLMDVQQGMLASCSERHYTMLLCPFDARVDDAGDETAAEHSLRARLEEALGRARPDGLLLTPPLTDDARLHRLLQSQQRRYACLSPWLTGPGEHADIGARMDDTAAVRELVRELIARGHREIAYLDGPSEHGASHWRRAGVLTALAEIGSCLDPRRVARGDFSFESALPAAAALLDQQPRPTVIFAANDDMAAAVLRVAWERGIEVPSELSVCGFDDSPISRQLNPPLTTIRQPTFDMSRTATTELMDLISGASSGRMHTLPYRILWRGTVAECERSGA